MSKIDPKSPLNGLETEAIGYEEKKKLAEEANAIELERRRAELKHAKGTDQAYYDNQRAALNKSVVELTKLRNAEAKEGRDLAELPEPKRVRSEAEALAILRVAGPWLGHSIVWAAAAVAIVYIYVVLG